MAAAAALVATHVVVTMFWSRFDQVDDTGYMLAILRGLSGGGRLYEDVFSQYGPFYAMAWLPWFRITGSPIDHNHAALGVVVLWFASCAIAAWLVHRHTRSAGWTGAALLWTAWSLTKLGSELAHPKSLVVMLCALLLAALARVCHRRDWVGPVLAGAILAALVLTKVNVGAFALIAAVMGSLAGLIPRKPVAVLTGLAGAALPFVLLRHAWEPDARLLLGFSAWISSFMTVQIAASRRQESPALAAVIDRGDARMLAGACAAAASAILLLALAWGTGARALLDGVLLRPLSFASVFQVPPAVTWIETLPVLASALLALAWQIPSLRRRAGLWRAAMIAAALAEILWDASRGWNYLFTAPALLWLAAAAASHGRREVHDHPGSEWWLAFAIHLAAWQALSIFPVNGAQSSLPRFLSSIVFLLGLREALAGLAIPGRVLPHLVSRATIAALAIGLAGLGWNAGQFARANMVRHIPFRGAGADWFHWRPEQVARLNSVAENLKQQPGPVLTFHGQPSLALWSGKSVIQDSNRLHFVHLVGEDELAATLQSFAAEPAWSAVSFGDGLSFGGGPQVDRVRNFIREQTVPWLRMGEYELRLSKGGESRPPVSAAWKDGATWKITLPQTDAAVPKKGRLNDGSGNLASFKWEGFDWKPVGHAPGYVESPAPAPLAAALEKYRAPGVIVIAHTSKWSALFALPVVEWTGHR